jgi:cytochrome c553
MQPVAICNECHDTAANDDWVFTQCYPVLQVAKNSARPSSALNRVLTPEFHSMSNRFHLMKDPIMYKSHFSAVALSFHFLVLVSLITIAGGCNRSSVDNKDAANAEDVSKAMDSRQSQTGSGPVQFNDQGELVRPTDYRSWVFVGTPVTPNDMNNGEAPFPDFHNVYIDPASYRHYVQTGKFRQGTVLVKELVSVGSKQATSGNGYFMGDFLGLETTIKSKDRYPDEPGNWAYYSFGHSYPLAAAAKPFDTNSCNSCHEGSAADDFVFTQYYPVLRAAKGAKTNPENAGIASTHDGEQCPTCKAGVARLGMAGESAQQPSAETPATNSSGIATEKNELFKYLQAAAYKNFTAKETAKHPSVGPHTKYGLPIQVYLNETLNASLTKGNASHPPGSAAIKEMFDKDNKLQGWAVMLKTAADSDRGKGWFWYEVTSTTDGSKPVRIGNGVTLCAGCHASGKDYVLTDYPLK